MPVLLLPERCDNLPHCFAATVCPNQALFYDETSGQVVILAERCGDCRGPCLNFCDHYALKFASSLEELRLLQAELDGTMSAEEIAQERSRLQQAEEEKHKQDLVPQVTAQTFQQDVLQAHLPVLVEVQSSSQEVGSALQQVARRYTGQLLVRRIHSDTEPQLVAALRVRQVPTYLFFYQGQLLNGVAGMPSAGQMQTWLEPLLEQVRAFELTQQGLPEI